MITALVALLVLFVPTQEATCGPEGQEEMRQLHRETQELIDKIEADYMRGLGLNDEVIERYVELREKQQELREWVARCKLVAPRRRG
jgi:hypothetical protein